jgi:uncharacterized protein YcaQ
LHPRNTIGLSELEKKVLGTVLEIGAAHPREMDVRFGHERVRNDWGGYSKATKRALEGLHRRGLLRIARREKGIRIYEAASVPTNAIPATERLRKLIMVIANIFSPAPKKSLQARIAPVGRSVAGPNAGRIILSDLLRTGELHEETIDGVTYVWPPGKTVQHEVPRSVRFLAPFDPLVWDRERFEHLWEWPYRFEAYTHPTKRLRGYYAMPLLWGDSVIGWSNVNVSGEDMNVELGFIEKRPRASDFSSELDVEIGRMKTFLKSRTAT